MSNKLTNLLIPIASRAATGSVYVLRTPEDIMAESPKSVQSRPGINAYQIKLSLSETFHLIRADA
jgi:hypothetical protein